MQDFEHRKPSTIREYCFYLNPQIVMKTQWECFLQNLGEWQGSFAEFSPTGELREEIPSLLRLEEIEPGQARLTLRRDSPQFPEPLVQEYRSFNQSLLFFETGAFSQGARQYSPVSQFGGEFGLVNASSDRRLRLVQLYDSASELQFFKLIREQRVGTTAPERPHLQVEDLLGEWQGEAVTMFPDLRSPLEFSSHLQIERQGDLLQQKLSFGSRTIATEATIEGNLLKYHKSPMPVQIVLLPDGASANCPTQVSTGHPFVLEVGWLMEPTLRQRIMRSYDAKGEWINVTLVTERKIG
jgi:Domain of unknown function (DUF3598)